MTAPELEGVEEFRILGFDFDAERNIARFEYGFDDAVRFEETVAFGGPRLDESVAEGFNRALRLVHLAAGTSYFKAAAPHRIVVETGPLSPLEAALVTDLYDKGLREFAVANQLGVPLGFELTSSSVTPNVGRRVAPPRGVAVPIGGGKDSIVLVEALKAAEEALLSPAWLVAVNPRPAMYRSAKVAGLPLASITRTISPRLLELNASGALNGHVPVTAIVSLISVAAGYLYGYDTTLMALERSADEETRSVGGVGVNHQWSKSSECELALRSVVRQSVSDDIEYCSPLRSCGELEIARWFAALPAYHAGFRSCNRAYRSGTSFDSWCGECPKCRFVFLALVPFLDPGRLTAIFGRNLFDDPAEVEGFRDLFAAGRKPFECVGERRESLAAFLLACENPSWKDTVVVAALAREVHIACAEAGIGTHGGVYLIDDESRTFERVVAPINRLLGRLRTSGE